MASSSSASDDAITQLMAMGFDASQSQSALEASQGDLERAVEFLLGGNLSTLAAATAFVSSDSGQDQTVVSIDSSQYSYEMGRSACTCIALEFAKNFYQNQPIDQDFLTRGLKDGVQVYETKFKDISGAEHKSAEEILQQGQSYYPWPLVAVRQGILSRDAHHPLGLRSLLEGCSSEVPLGSPLSLLMTKTPETIVILRTTKAEWWIVDSHPRPQQGCEGAYARKHGTLDSLIRSLEVIFPVTDLGPDIPEMMAMMYNSFDVYPLLAPTS